MNTVQILSALKEHPNRHDIIFWEYCNRPNATIEKVTVPVNRKSDSGYHYTEHRWTGNYRVEGVGQTKVTRDLDTAERTRKKFQDAIDAMPRRRFAMPRTLSDFIKGYVYAGYPIMPEQTTLFDT